MNSIQIKNLRSLKDTGKIEIKKVNILVGNNSSGKSTFLRVFPLFKQSFDKRINGPILWGGDDEDYVDFGSFNEAINYHADEKTIRFSFDFDTEMDSYMKPPVDGKILIERVKKENVKMEFAIIYNDNSKYDYVSEINFVFRNYEILMTISERNTIEQIKVCGKKIILENLIENQFLYLYETPIFDISLSQIRIKAKEEIAQILGMDCKEEDVEEKEAVQVDMYIRYIFETRFHSVNSKEESANIINEELEERVNDAYSKYSKEEIEKWIFLYYLPRYFSRASDYLTSYFRNVYYIAPVRATAERYYRLRNAAVNEVDCRGKNLPVFLNSLPKELFQQFQKWTMENLGFEVEKITSEGHVSLKIKRNGQSKAVNLSDTGFGYSQILPIVTQLWYIVASNNQVSHKSIYMGYPNVPITFVIEQPELHLHPALQAKLIDIIVKVACKEDVNFIIETHSETIVNRVGNLVDKKKIEETDVGIVLFEKDYGDDNTKVSKSNYDEEGYLENWPIGFFEPMEVE